MSGRKCGVTFDFPDNTAPRHLPIFRGVQDVRHENVYVDKNLIVCGVPGNIPLVLGDPIFLRSIHVGLYLLCNGRLHGKRRRAHVRASNVATAFWSLWLQSWGKSGKSTCLSRLRDLRAWIRWCGRRDGRGCERSARSLHVVARRFT